MLKGEGKLFDWLAVVEATKKANGRPKRKANMKASRRPIGR